MKTQNKIGRTRLEELLNTSRGRKLLPIIVTTWAISLIGSVAALYSLRGNEYKENPEENQKINTNYSRKIIFQTTNKDYRVEQDRQAIK